MPWRIEGIVSSLLNASQPADLSLIEQAIELAGASHATYTLETPSRVRDEFRVRRGLHATCQISRTASHYSFKDLEQRREWRKETENPHIPAHLRFMRLMHLCEYPLAKHLLAEMTRDLEDLKGEQVREITRLLISEGFTDMLFLFRDAITVHMQDNHHTLLFSAIDRQEPNMQILSILVEDLEVNLNVVDHNGLGVLHRLFRVDHNRLGQSCNPVWWKATLALPYLVSRGADINMQDEDGSTPLHYALDDFGLVDFDIRLIERLVTLGADVTAADRVGQTYLCRTIRRRSNVCVPPEAQVDKSNLRHAVTGRLALARLLLKNGATVTQSNPNRGPTTSRHGHADTSPIPS